MGGSKRPQPDDHINTDFSFWTDRSPIHFDTSERNKDGHVFAIDSKQLSEYKREAQEPLNELLSMGGRVWILCGEDNFNLFQNTTEFAKALHLLHTVTARHGKKDEWTHWMSYVWERSYRSNF
jgi:hypothetical protein